MQGRARIAEGPLVARPEPDLVIDLRDPPEQGPPETPRRRSTGIVLLVALNALNLVDAVLTHIVTSAGLAVEGNPLVRWLTLPGKVVLVAALSLVLWKLRPRALVIPVAGYGAVVAYTVAGALWLSP